MNENNEMNILYFISDHGFGHATRSIALLRKLEQNFKDLNVVIYNKKAFGFLNRGLPGFNIVKIQSDVGPVTKPSLNKIDPENTFQIFSDWIKNEEKWVKKIKKNLKFSPDLIITDISPMGLRLAEDLRCAAITIANFSWNEILLDFPFHPEKKEIIGWLKDSFSISQMTLKVPLSMNLVGFKNIKKTTFVCREPNTTKKNVLNELKIPSSLIASYLGKILSVQFKKPDKHQSIIPLNIALDKKLSPKGIEGQDIIMSSNLVISKIGHSILSECVKYRIPMLVIPRGNYVEDSTLAQHIEKLNMGRVLPYNTKLITVPDDEKLIIMKKNLKEDKIRALEKLSSPLDFIYEFKK